MIDSHGFLGHWPAIASYSEIQIHRILPQITSTKNKHRQLHRSSIASKTYEMGPDIEMKASNEGIELAITSSQEHNKSTVNGLAAHMEVELSAEEIKAEKRYVLKVDCTILPLLVLSVFLASLVRITPFVSQVRILRHLITLF